MSQSLGWNCPNDEMAKQKGRVVTIEGIYYGQYVISELSPYRWTDEMFEGKAEDITGDFTSFYDYIGGV
ncbi:MAG: hypothetical protein ACI4KR_09175 [Ruminiclostridium sp.]